MKYHSLVFIILLLFAYLNNHFVAADHPSYPSEFPIDEAYISQSTSCFLDDIITWTCPPCDKTSTSYRLLDNYSASGIEQFIFVNQLYHNIIVAYRYSYSKEMKGETFCNDNPQRLFQVSSNTVTDRQTCITNADVYMSDYIYDILRSSDDTPSYFLDLLYQRIQQTIDNYPFNRNQLIFTGYEIGGSIAQVVNSYYMIRNTLPVTIGSITGCLPENSVRLYQFGSPKSINYVKDIIDQVYRESPLFSEKYLDNYWYLFNIINYKDPIPAYPQTSSSNNDIEYIQSVYYDGVEIIGYCDAKSDCDLQNPPFQESEFLVEKHYSIYDDIIFVPETSTDDQYCNFYPDQIRFIDPSINYLNNLCSSIVTTKTTSCTQQCQSISDNSLCDCSNTCSFRDSENPYLAYECCSNICSTCSNPICVGSIIPPMPSRSMSPSPSPSPSIIPISSTGATCDQSIRLETPDTINFFYTKTIQVRSNQPFGYSRSQYNCIFLSQQLYASSNVVWFYIDINVEGVYEFDSSLNSFGTGITIWKSCQIFLDQCSATSTEFYDEDGIIIDDGLVNIYLKSGRYYISLTSDLPEQLGDYNIKYFAKSFDPIISITKGDNFLNRIYNLSKGFIINSLFNTRALPTCKNRCSETEPTNNPNVCNCYIGCNPFIDPTCCEDICTYCTRGVNNNIGAYNEYCTASYNGTYIGTCENRCNEDKYPPNACACGNEGILGTPIMCLDYEEFCPNSEPVIEPQYLSCENRCGELTFISPNGTIDYSYIVGCTADGMAQVVSKDINEVCDNINKNVDRNYKTTASCEGACFQSDVDSRGCSCLSDCKDKGNCCADYCEVCLPDAGSLCDLNIIPITFPPSVYQRQKYYQLSQAPRCINEIDNYLSWDCDVCNFYPGYTDYQKYIPIGNLYKIYINYNRIKKETIINIGLTNSEYFYNGINFSLEQRNYVSVQYGIDSCVNEKVGLYYISNFYDDALLIYSRIIESIGGLSNYLSDKKGSYITIIGHNQGGGIAHIIYDRFVLDINVNRFISVTGNCPPIGSEVGYSFSKYYLDQNEDNAVTIQGFCTAEPNIFYTVSSLQYNLVLGNQWNGIDKFNENYRMFSIVNSYDFYSNIIRGYAGFQTYFTRPVGGVAIQPCYYYGAYCFPVNEFLINGALTGTVAVSSYGLGVGSYLSSTFVSRIEPDYILPYAGNLASAGDTVRFALDKAKIFWSTLGTVSVIGTSFVSNYEFLETISNNIFETVDSIDDITSENIFAIELEFIRDLLYLFTSDDINNTFFSIKLPTICSIDLDSNNINEIREEFISKLITDEDVEIIIKNFYSKVTKMINEEKEMKERLKINDKSNSIIDREVSLYDVNEKINSTYDKLIEYRTSDYYLYNIKNTVDDVNDTRSFVYTGESIYLPEDTIRGLIIAYREQLYKLSSLDIPTFISGKPSTRQFNFYYNMLSIGFAPYSELQSFNCSMCTYYKSLNYILLRWEHYDYYDLFWITSNIRKEVIILMSTDNYPETIYESVCEDPTSINGLNGQISIGCLGSAKEFVDYTFYYTDSTEYMFPKNRFKYPYLSTDYTATLMKDPNYRDHVFTYMGFGSACSYTYQMYIYGYINYNLNETEIYNSTCTQYKVQAVLFSPLSDFLLIENEYLSEFQFTENVKVFMNPCDGLPILGSFSRDGSENYYQWNSNENSLHSYYVNDTESVIDFNDLSYYEKNCIIDILENGTIIHDYTVYPSHFTIGGWSPIYGYLRDAQQLYSNIAYEEVVYEIPRDITQDPTEFICPLLSNYPYENQTLPQVPLNIQQPPLSIQLHKYYKLNMISYGDYNQILNGEYGVLSSNNDISNFTIVDKFYNKDWTLTAYYSKSINEVVISLMARNDTFLYGESVCKITINNTSPDYIILPTNCDIPNVPWLIGYIDENYSTDYFRFLFDILQEFYIGKSSTVTFTGVGLGAGFHKLLILETMSYNGGIFGIQDNECILEAQNTPRFQSLFFSSTRNQYYQDIYSLIDENTISRNITMSKFFTTVIMNDDANYISEYNHIVPPLATVIFPTSLEPMWVYVENQAIPYLSNSNSESLTSEVGNRFYNTYYNIPSIYYNQSNWIIEGNNVLYVQPVLNREDMYNIIVSDNNEACLLLSGVDSNYNNTISDPPTLVESEIYSYFSMLVYCQYSQILDESCENLNQKGSLSYIIDTFELTDINYSDNSSFPARVYVFKSDIYKLIIYTFGFSSDEQSIKNYGCLVGSIPDTNLMTQVNYNIGVSCSSSRIGIIRYKLSLYTGYVNWIASLLRQDVRSNLLDSDYKIIFTGNSLGASIAHIAYVDIQISTLINRETCETNSNLQMILFGEEISANIQPVNSNIVTMRNAYSMINRCDAVPYLDQNTIPRGYIYWIIDPNSGKTYTLTENYELTQVTYNDISGNYSSCPVSNGYSIEFNREYIGKRSFVGYTIINPSFSKGEGEEEKFIYEHDEHPGEEFYNYNYNHDDYDISNNGRTTIDNICSTVITPPTRIDYRGPTKSQLSKYNKLMSYSYYPVHPVNISNIPPFINPQDVEQMFDDPQINAYINNENNGEQFAQFHKIVYYTNYENREFVISVIPTNRTDPYFYYSCPLIVETIVPGTGPIVEVADGNLWNTFLGNQQLGDYNSLYKGYSSALSLDIIASNIRNIQQIIFEEQILPGHGSKSDWTITFISKDTGNNAVLYFLFKYYYRSLNYETLGGINRYKVQNSGYKYFQTLGFGYILDKWQSNDNIFFDVVYPSSLNIVGKNIFMTVSIYNDLLSTQAIFEGRDTVCTDPWDPCLFISDPCPRCQSGEIFDKWHRAILYDQDATMIEDLSYYKCNKYNQFIGPDTKTLYSSDRNVCLPNRTIVREYFQLPNYFYRYSNWFCGVSGCTYDPNYIGNIEYDNPSFDICKFS